MDFFDNPVDFMVVASALLLLLLTTNRALDMPYAEEANDKVKGELVDWSKASEDACTNMDVVTWAALHNIRLCNVFTMFDDDLGYWVKPRSTTWFSRFLLEQYDEDRWVKMFRMTKPAVFFLADLLRPHVQKKDTKYRLAIPVLVRVACTLFKLTHGASLLICSEFFAVGRSTVSMVLREVVHGINDALRSEILWPTGERLTQTQVDFQKLCGLPGVVGAIDGTHVSISKPKFGPADYFYFKSGGYSLNCQAVVDSNKRFLDLYLGMPGSTNDSQMLRRSSLYRKAMHNNLFDSRFSVANFSPYLLGDAGYPLLPWLMVPHRGLSNLPLADTLFNRKLRRGRGVVENAFGILKQSFRELHGKFDLNVAFFPDVITCCAILHNELLGQLHEDVERLLQILQTEGLQGKVVDEEVIPAEPVESLRDNEAFALRTGKRHDLGVYLALQRRPAPYEIQIIAGAFI